MALPLRALAGVEVEDMHGHAGVFPVGQADVHGLAKTNVPADVVAKVVITVGRGEEVETGELGVGVSDGAVNGRKTPADGGDGDGINGVIEDGLIAPIAIFIGHVGAVTGLAHAGGGGTNRALGKLRQGGESAADAAIGENAGRGVGRPGGITIVDFGLGVIEGIGGVAGDVALGLVVGPPIGRFVHGVLLSEQEKKRPRSLGEREELGALGALLFVAHDA